MEDKAHVSVNAPTGYDKADAAYTNADRLQANNNAAQKHEGAHFLQPKVTGYRQLTESEAQLMNTIKQKGQDMGALVDFLRSFESLDQRWVSIGATDIQKGLMALTRAVARPTTF